MNSEAIKDAIYDVLRLHYRPVGQNELWDLVEESFHTFVSPKSKTSRVLERKIDESKRFSKHLFRKALTGLLEDGRVYVYDDKETKLGRKLYYAKVDYDELRDIIPARLDRLLNVYQEQLDSILNKSSKLDNNERAKILWKLHLLLFTAEHQVKIYSKIFSDKLGTKTKLSRIKNMRNAIDRKSHHGKKSSYEELTQNLLNEVIHTAVTCQDSIDNKRDLKS